MIFYDNGICGFAVNFDIVCRVLVKRKTRRNSPVLLDNSGFTRRRQKLDAQKAYRGNKNY